MEENAPVIWWVRRDLRLHDNQALCAAATSGRPVIPVFILDETVSCLGAAPKWRLGQGINHLAETLEKTGSRLVLRKGSALETLQALISEAGAREVHWSRLYDPTARSRDTEVKAALKEAGIDAQSHPGHVLFEPWTVETKGGAFYRVYSPFWRAVRDRDPGTPMARPSQLAPPRDWPRSDALADWAFDAPMKRGAEIVMRYASVGEGAAQERLERFVTERLNAYKRERDLPGVDATSRLSEPLAYGEISPRTIWAAGLRAMDQGSEGAEHFLKELVWRDFAYHLIYHTPHIAKENWRKEWQAFPWNTDTEHAHVVAWKRGCTGVPFVDAAMREMYVTGHMHNRARMIVASYLTKHLMSHWRIGLDWFADCLTDWDPASNAMGWQWAAGSGPDAAPYFRIFNPATQLDKFDPDRIYAHRWIAELTKDPPDTALDYFNAVPHGWNMSPSAPYPDPIVALDEGRKRALHAYETRAF